MIRAVYGLSDSSHHTHHHRTITAPPLQKAVSDTHEWLVETERPIIKRLNRDWPALTIVQKLKGEKEAPMLQLASQLGTITAPSLHHHCATTAPSLMIPVFNKPPLHHHCAGKCFKVRIRLPTKYSRFQKLPAAYTAVAEVKNTHIPQTRRRACIVSSLSPSWYHYIFYAFLGLACGEVT